MEDRMAGRRNRGSKSLRQPDEFITLSSKLLRQVIEHRNKIIAALGGIVVLVLAFSIVDHFSQKAEEQSFSLLSKALDRYDTLQNESDVVEAYSGVKEDLNYIIENFGNKSGGKLANFFLANCSFAAEEYETSIALYRKSVEDFRGVAPFGSLAKSSLGYALARQGDHKAAVEVFKELSDTGAPGMEDEVLFALFRQYAAIGMADLQQETARKLIEAYPDSIYSNVVKEKVAGFVQPSEG